MRKNYYIIIFILFFIGCSTNEQSDKTANKLGFVGVGYGVYSYSESLKTWDKKTDNQSLYYNVNYINNKYIAVGKSGKIITSCGGIIWCNANNSDSNDLYDVTYSNQQGDEPNEGGKYVAVGSNGTILTSSDAYNWTKVSSGTTNTLYGITYTNEWGRMFVAVGSSGIILTSEDGISWTSQTSGTSSTLYSVLAAKIDYTECCGYTSHFVIAVGSNGTIISGPVGYNYNGPYPSSRSWSNLTSGVTVTLKGVALGNDNKIVAVGYESGYNITTSSDAYNWTASTNNNSFTHSDITFGNGQFLTSAKTYYGVSSDGTNWTYYSTGSTSISLEGVAY